MSARTLPEAEILAAFDGGFINVRGLARHFECSVDGLRKLLQRSGRKLRTRDDPTVKETLRKRLVSRGTYRPKRRLRLIDRDGVGGVDGDWDA